MTTATLTGRRLSTDERQEELLRFGRAFFAEHAVDALSMAAIARKAGVSKSLLYHYFGGRRGFYVATIRSIADDVIDRTTPEDGVGFDAALRGALTRYLRFVRANGAVYRVLVQAGLGVDAEAGAIVDEVRQTAIRRVLEQLSVRRPNAALRVALYGWVCFVEHACLAWLDEARLSLDRMLDVVTDALTPALRALARPNEPEEVP